MSSIKWHKEPLLGVGSELHLSTEEAPGWPGPPVAESLAALAKQLHSYKIRDMSWRIKAFFSKCNCMKSASNRTGTNLLCQQQVQ